jgi:FAD/FMN-containing dehydrogenase
MSNKGQFHYFQRGGGMDVVARRGTDGTDVALPRSAVGRLEASLAGTLLTPESDGYDAACAVWNGMIERRPALIARCADAADVAQAVRFARDHELLLAVRGGGHNIAGSGVCDGGLVIDLSGMRAVSIDAAARTARVQPGATLADFDGAAQAHGLATPVGINSTTGVAGLTLGGGFGWLSRKYGLTVDNLLAADMVLADGTQVRVSEDEEPDLFWAIRGGGGNFGVATTFEFRLQPVGPEVLAGLIVHPLADAGRLLRTYRTLTAAAPDELSVWAVLRQAPPLPFVPAEWHGREVLVFALCYAGDVRDGERAIEPFRRLGTPIAEAIGAQPFAAWQQAFDPLLTPGARNYWKSHDFTQLADGAIDTVVDFAGRLPGPECEIFIAHIGGAVNRVAADATAYPHRDVEFVLNVHTRWREPADDGRFIAWARSFFDDAAPFATGGVYVNFMPQDEGSRVPAAYGPNYGRLALIKARFDPANLFRTNQNILPEPVAM